MIRQSKDGKINSMGIKLIKFIEETGCSIFNGNTRGNEEGEYTFTGGKRCSVIDYVIEDKEMKKKIKRLRIENKVDMDHHPVEVWIKGVKVRRRVRKEKKDKERGFE